MFFSEALFLFFRDLELVLSFSGSFLNPKVSRLLLFSFWGDEGCYVAT
jgi:hypothetical protein